MEPHYKIVRTNAGWHVTIVAGNTEYVTSSEVLTSNGAALRNIAAVAAMHSPCIHATIDPKMDKVWVFQYPQAIAREGNVEGVYAVPIRYSDERAPKLLERVVGAVGRRIMGVPADVEARARVGRG